MRLRKSLARLWQRMRHPLPNAEREADKFFSCPLRYLLFDQIAEIVRFILDEAQKSRRFGLYIERKDLEGEELFFLAVINALGGVARMRREVPREGAHRVITEAMWKHFADTARRYFKQADCCGESVHNKYNCHLESVRNRLLHEIYDVTNPKLYTA